MGIAFDALLKEWLHHERAFVIVVCEKFGTAQLKHASEWSWKCASAVLCVLLVSGKLDAQALQVGALRIDSVPSAAEVEVIGGKVGVTPLTVTERDLYPNNYPDARAALYGTVTLHHAGCQPLRHRVTLGDLKRDLHLRMDCVAAVPPVTAQAVVPASVSSVPAPLTPLDRMPQQRLRQLQVLQELLDEGLINPAEEQRVRRRILQVVPRTGAPRATGGRPLTAPATSAGTK